MKKNVGVYNEFILAPFTSAIQGDFSREIILETRSLIYLLGDSALEMQC